MVKLNKKIIDDSDFISLWKSDMIKTIKKINPKWDKHDIEKIVNDKLKESTMIPEVEMDNNYTGEHRNTTLLSVFDWIIRRKPIIAGNGTFYKNQHEAINPIAQMLDDFLIKRKLIKKKMFSLEDDTSDLYADMDRNQGNVKKLANSYYGASGMPKSAFYSKWSGPATTGSAQSIISATESLFEGFLVDNYKFIDINEVFHYMNQILLQEYELPKWIVRVSADDLYKKMIDMFYEDVYLDEYEEPIRRYISHLTDDEITKIFYKNQLFLFIKTHDKVLNLFDKLFCSIKNLPYANSIDEIPKDLIEMFESSDNDKQMLKDYNAYVNAQYFMNPNSPPDTIIDILTKLNKYCMTYVYFPYISIDKIYRLKFFNRKTVCIVDTDSNILTLDSWIDFCKNNIISSDYGRSDENNEFIMINTLAYFITSAVSDILDTYGKYSNIPEEYRKRFTMKNEYYFSKLIIGRKKKRYISAIKLREGTLLKPYKADVKGFDYAKATTSQEAKKRFDKIVKDCILESDIPNTSAILERLWEFESDIRDSIDKGELTYLPLGNAKDLKAYKNPYSIQGVRGAIAWNVIYPDREISFPSKVSLLKLNIFTIEDIDDLRTTYPDIYEKIKNEIFGSSIEKIASKGLQVLSIPGNESIPEWCKPYIDYNTVINNILGQFRGVLDVFGIECPETGKTIKSVNRKTKRFSNIVRF